MRNFESDVRSTRAVQAVAKAPGSRDFTRISQEILQHLSAMEGVDLDITVEIRASKSDGFPEDKVRVILENSSALKFDQSGFESG